MQPKARMTFRFDPPTKPAEAPLKIRTESQAPRTEPEAPRPEPASAASPADFQTGGLLLDDPYTLEELIRNAGAVRPPISAIRPDPKIPQTAQQPPQPESDPGPLYDPDLVGWDLPGDWAGGGKGGFRKHEMTAGPSWWRAFVTVAGAVVTGALFGYLVLTLFTGEPVLPDKPGGSPAAPAQAASGAAAAAGAEMPAQTYYLLQYGVFRTEESLDAALEQLKNKGYPAVGDRTDGFRAFAGAAATKEEAERLAGQMPNVPVFVKEMTSAAVKTDGTGAAQGLAAFVRLSHELAKKLGAWSVDALQDEMPQPIGDAELTALRETFRQWTAASSAADGLSPPAKDAAKEIERALNAAMVSVDDYGRNVSRFHLWRVQEDVTDVVLADKALRSSLSAGAAK